MLFAVVLVFGSVGDLCVLVLLVSTVVDSVLLSVFEGCDCVSCLVVLAM